MGVGYTWVLGAGLGCAEVACSSEVEKAELVESEVQSWRVQHSGKDLNVVYYAGLEHGESQ